MVRCLLVCVFSSMSCRQTNGPKITNTNQIERLVLKVGYNSNLLVLCYELDLFVIHIPYKQKCPQIYLALFLTSLRRMDYLFSIIYF